MPTITGNITIADLVDGVTGATIVFTNESHTFTADPDGEVSDLTGFSSDVAVYAGTTQFDFSGSVEAACGTFYVEPEKWDGCHYAVICFQFTNVTGVESAFFNYGIGTITDTLAIPT